MILIFRSEVKSKSLKNRFKSSLTLAIHGKKVDLNQNHKSHEMI